MAIFTPITAPAMAIATGATVPIALMAWVWTSFIPVPMAALTSNGVVVAKAVTVVAADVATAVPTATNFFLMVISPFLM
jgi:hypothetical protein